MIIKSFEVKKINIKNFKNILVYGENDGLKNEIIKKNILNDFLGDLQKYDEKDILKDYDTIISSLINKSFFDKEKIVIISRATDRIVEFIEIFDEKKITDIIFIISSDRLEKRSKLRQIFEKKKNFACVPVYQDDEKTLRLIADDFFKKENISVSSEIINQIIYKCSGDRGYLVSELDKIKIYLNSQNKINLEEITILTNLSENYSVSELIDCCLSKNQIRTIKILNENVYTSEDAILIIRMFLSKLKRILNLRKKFQINGNFDMTINSFRPPIFWKDKEIIKKQIMCWSSLKLENLIIRSSDIELNMKKNSNISLKIVYDFILEICGKTSN